MARISWIVLAALAPGLALAAPEFRRAGEAAWTCGGIGSDERRAMESLRAQAGLEIVFASAKRGAYLPGATWSLAREGGPALLEGVAEGPVCLVQAPPGSYRIEARLGDVRRTARATVPAAGRRAARIVIAFPDEPWDGIRASEEEKAQAARP